MERNRMPLPLPRPASLPIPTEEEASQIAAELNANARTGIPPAQVEQGIIDKLPRITEEQLTALGEQDSSCSICLNTLLAVIAEEEMASVMDSVIYPIEEFGVTKLNQAWQCGHMFCRRDIMRWVKEGRRTCPMCRRALREPITEENQREAGPTFGIPIEITPEMLITTRHVMNADFTILEPDPDDPNPPPFAELRRRFLEANPGVQADLLDRMTTGETVPEEQRNPVWEDWPPPEVAESEDMPPPEGMYS